MTENDTNKTTFYNFGDCHLDVSKRRLLKKGKPIDLAQKTFNILNFFLENQGDILTKEQLLKRFWDREFVEEGILTQQIYKIRKAIKDESSGENYIETINKVGYRFTGKVNLDTNTLNFLDTKPFNQKSYNNEINKSKYVNIRSSLSYFQKKLWAVVIFAFLMLGLASYNYLAPVKKKRLSSIQSLVILPFEQIGDTENEKLEIGLADILISKFINQKKISVPPTSVILKFSEKEREDIIEIGRKLKVDAVLTGTIQSDMGTARVNVQLIDVERGVPIWANKFDIDFADVFSLQDEISQQVIKKIPIQLEEGPEKSSF